MIPDLNFVTDTFHKCNNLIFKGSLPVPRFVMTRARTFRGKLVYQVKKSILKTQCRDFEMRISISFDLEPMIWEDVVIHEMIHLQIASSGIKDKSSHGPVFRKRMNEINKTFGRKISVSARSTPGEISLKSGQTKVKGHFVCIAKFSDGRLGVAPVAKTRLFALWDNFPNFPNLISLKWIGSVDPWFNSFPHVQKPKFFLVKESELLEHLRGAKPLERTGNRIRVINRHCSPDELLP